MSKSISLDLAKKPFNSKKEGEWLGHPKNSQLFLHLYMEKMYHDSLFTIKPLLLAVINHVSPPRFAGYHLARNNMPDVEYQLSDGEMISNKYIERYRNTKKRFTYFPLTIFNRKTGHHLIPIIYDKNLNRVEFQDNINLISDIQKVLSEDFKRFFRNIYGNSVKFDFKTSYCGTLKILGKVNYCEDYLFKSRGYCAIYTLWYLELRLKNPNLTKRQIDSKIISYFKKAPHKFCELIIGYADFVNETIKDYELLYKEIDEFSAIRSAIQEKKIIKLTTKLSPLLTLIQIQNNIIEYIKKNINKYILRKKSIPSIPVSTKNQYK